jgi:hypothetical protein
MKIEIGESICFSWLKHVKGCQVVQLNWKAPVFDTGISNEATVKQIFNFYKNKYRTEIDLNQLFGNNTYSQLIKQGEVDALGLDISKDSIYYNAIDVAFHENGLNYGSKKETVARILKKYIRTAMTLISTFDCQNADIYFISPKISQPILNLLEPLVTDLNDSFIEKQFGNFRFRLISGDSFEEKIMMNIYSLSSKVSDGNELFLRSVQLINSCRNHNLSYDKMDFDEKKVGKIVREDMFSILSSKNVPISEIENLCNSDYCKQTFGTSDGVSVLKRFNDENDRFDEKGIARFYADMIEISDTEYLVNNQWYDKNKDKLIKWMMKYY